VALAGVGCGKKQDATGVATKPSEVRTKMQTATGLVDNLVLKGELPDWRFDGFAKLERREKVKTKAGEMELVVMDLEVQSWGGTGKGPTDFRQEIERTRDDLVGKQFGGEAITLEKPLTELTPGVWSFVTKARDFAGGDVHEVFVYHFDPALPLMHRCKGQARATYADDWTEIERICSGLTITLADDNPSRAVYR
jgi:hypothetical protein